MEITLKLIKQTVKNIRVQVYVLYVEKVILQLEGQDMAVVDGKKAVNFLQQRILQVKI